MFLKVPGRSGTRLSLDEFLDQGGVSSEITKDKSGSFHVKAAFDFREDDRGHLELWFDASINYLVHKMVLTTDKYPEMRWEYAVERFEEPSPGVFFPTKSTVLQLSDGKVRSKASCTLSDLHINEPLPASQFTLEIPPGTRMSDTIQGIIYTTSANGPVPGSVTPSHPPVSFPPPSSRSSSEEEPYTTQTEREPMSWGRAVLFASLGVLGTAGIYWVWQKRKRASLS